MRQPAVGVRRRPRLGAVVVMRLRIGTMLDGQPAVVESVDAVPVVLLGDPGSGKTTLARYLARWWLADTRRHGHVFSSEPGEWVDFRNRLAPRLTPAACRPGECLAVIEGSCAVPLGLGKRLADVGAKLLITASTVGEVEGLLPLDSGRRHVMALLNSRSTLADGAQGRLDWPSDAVVVFPDQRGEYDLPCHRWRRQPTEIGEAS